MYALGFEIIDVMFQTAPIGFCRVRAGMCFENFDAGFWILMRA